MKLIFRLYYLTLKLLYRTGLLCLVLFQVEGQNLCNSSEAIPNGFDLLTPSVGCGPMTVEVKTKTGLTDVKYIYNYNGESKDQLSKLGPLTNTSYTYFKENETKKYTILQYGKTEEGKNFYSCKNVTVNLISPPYFTTSACNNNFLQISVPDTSINNFDYYEVDYDDGKKNQVIHKSELPFIRNLYYDSLEPYRTLVLHGKYKDNLKNCEFSSEKEVPMKSGSDYPNIDTLEIINDNSLKLVFSGSSKQFYDIYNRFDDESYAFGRPSYKLTPGRHIIDIDTQSRICFTLFRNYGCMETSGESCTVRINPIKSFGKNNLLSWNSHPENNWAYFGPGIPDSKTSSIQQTLETNKDDLKISKRIVKGSDFSDNDLPCNDKRCYRIITKITGSSRGSDQIPFTSISISNKECFDEKAIMPDSISNLNVSVINDSPIISFSDNSNWNLSKELYFLYLKNDSLSYQVFDSTNTIGFFLTDLNSNESSYCFRVAYKDECGSISKLSPEVCTVFLGEKNNINLSWSKESPFGIDTVVNLEVISIDEISGIEKVVYSQENMQPNTISPDLNEFEYEAKYYLKIYGHNSLSQSNLISIPINTKLFIPDAFSPNGDGINDLFKIYGNFGTLDSFDLKIIDRLGYFVFKSNDPKKYWDGTYKGVSSPSGYYNYIITGVTQKGEPIVKKGKLLLLQ